MSARSSAPLALRPQATADARKPGARAKLSGTGSRVAAPDGEWVPGGLLIKCASVAESSGLTRARGAAEALPVGSDRGCIHEVAANPGPKGRGRAAAARRASRRARSRRMRHHRPTLIAALAAAALFSPAAPRALAGPVPDTTGILTPWRIEPRLPCIHDSVTMVVRGFVATPCDSFMGAERIGPLHVRIHVLHYADRYCFAAPILFYPVPVPLGVFPAGSHTGLVDVLTTTITGDTASTDALQQFRFGFDVTPECGQEPPPPGQLPYVNSIGTDPEHPCSTQPTSLVLGGYLPSTCGQVIDWQAIDSEHVTLTLKPHSLADTVCAQSLAPWHVAFA